MNPRFFCPVTLHPGGSLLLPAAAAHHASGVLRLAPGAAVTLFDGAGGEYACRITAVKPEVTADVLARLDTEREAPLAITLAQVVPAGDRMDWVVEKAVELGVARLAPLMSARSVVRLAGERAERRRSHWQQVAVSAAEQCGRNRLMAVEAPQPLAAFLAEAATAGATRLVMMPRTGSNLSGLPAPRESLTLLVGPEGGLTEDECAAALGCGYRALRLGPRVLRADTAGLAAVAAVLARWGDF